MSTDLNVFLKGAKIPTAAQWTSALAAAGFKIRIDEKLDVARHSGYLPVEFDGEESGFELTWSDRGASFRCSGQDEIRAASAAAAVLARLTEGTVYDPQTDRSVSAPEAIPWCLEIHRRLGPPEARTPTQWRKHCLEWAQQIHRDYAANRDAKGRFIE